MLTGVCRASAMVAVLFLAACAKDTVHKMVVSIPDQKMALYQRNQLLHVYDVSTSRFCISARPGTNGTPLGKHEVAKKIGDGAPAGMKFSNRRPTGEIVRVNAPGRDPIVTRILWLKGLEPQNRTSFSRTIYIHGTPEEWRIGKPASFGCVRMRSHDVIEVFNTVGTGASVEIVNQHLELPTDPKVLAAAGITPPPAAPASASAATASPASETKKATPQVAQAKKAEPRSGETKKPAPHSRM